MRKFLQMTAVAALSLAAIESKAQLPDGSVAPNFTFTDMNGNTQDLYTYLNAGKSVVIDISATWCGPCWSYHNSNNLENFYNQYGPPGTNVAMVIFIEGDGATTNADMNGTGSNTQGNWTAGTPYPMCNPASAQVNPFNSAYQIGYFPTMYLICAADKKTKKVDQYTTAQLAAALNACPPVSPTQALDAGIPTVQSPNGIACGNTFSPVVTLKNFGLNTLTTVTINYRIDNNPNQTYTWNGSLASNAQVNVNLPSITATAGTHSFTCSTSNPNNGTDGNTGNDAKTTTFTASNANNILPVVEGMEAAFPNTGWTINNPDAATTWAKKTGVGKTGTASAYMDNYNYNANGEIDELVMPLMDLANYGNVNLTFQVAYQMYTDPASSPNYSDTLKVMISTDCGVTWTAPYAKFGTALTTVTPVFSTNEFIPTASQWRQETVPLPSSSSVMVKFYHATQYENQLYIDDINISGTGNPNVNEMNLDEFVALYPNPSSGWTYMDITRTDLGKSEIRVVSLVGETIMTFDATGTNRVKIDMTQLPSGMYFVELRTEQGKALKKIMINH